MQQYSLIQNKWKLHSKLPLPLSHSSAVILNQVIYTIGGLFSPHSVLWCDIDSIHLPLWKGLDLADCEFTEHYYRKALVLENKIVYFGTWNENATYVLEKEKQSHELRLVRQD